MHHIVVEHLYDPPVTEVALSAAFERLQPFLYERGLRRLRSWIADDGSRGFCEFEGSDIQSLADAYQQARVQFVRMWTGTLIEFGHPSEPERPSDPETSYEELADP
jgi:hypothetical protein